MDIKPGDMVSMYIRLRDQKKAMDDAHKKSCEKIVLGMEKLEGLMLAHLDATGAQSLATATATVYKSIQTSVSTADKLAFREWVEQTGEWDAVDLNANKTFEFDQIKAKQPLPPGITVSQIAIVGVQRK